MADVICIKLINGFGWAAFKYQSQIVETAQGFKRAL